MVTLKHVTYNVQMMLHRRTKNNVTFTENISYNFMLWFNSRQKEKHTCFEFLTFKITHFQLKLFRFSLSPFNGKLWKRNFNKQMMGKKSKVDNELNISLTGFESAEERLHQMMEPSDPPV